MNERPESQASGDPLIAAEPLPTSHAGLLVIAAVVGLLLAGATYLTVSEIANDSIDPSDGGVAEIAFLVGPLIAAFCALVAGLTVVIVAGLRLIPLRVNAAVRSMLIAAVGAPCVYLVGLAFLSRAVDEAGSGALTVVVILMVPAVLGTGSPLLLAWDQGRRARSRPSGETPGGRSVPALNQLSHPIGPTAWTLPTARQGGIRWRKAVSWFSGGLGLLFLVVVAGNFVARDGLAGLGTFVLGFILYALLPLLPAMVIIALWRIGRAIRSR